MTKLCKENLRINLPELPEEESLFRCSVPVDGICQAYIQDGRLQSINDMPKGLQISAGEMGLGMDVVLEPDQIMEAPLQVISVRSQELESPLAFSNHWTIRSGASAQMIVCDHTLKDLPYDTSRNTFIDIQKGASLEMLFMQNEYNASHYKLNIIVNQQENSNFRCHIITLHGGDIRNSLQVNLTAPKANCTINGIFLADGNQHISNHIDLVHQAPDCQSDQLLKGVLDGQSRGRFEGLIKVLPGAQKTAAYQANHNLILTKEAKMTTRPQLEIYADDVKCSHGASIGRMDQDALFYIQSRGIGIGEARLLQQMAFVYDVLDKIPWVAIRERLAVLVEKRLRGELSQCTHCTRHCC